MTLMPHPVDEPARIEAEVDVLEHDDEHVVMRRTRFNGGAWNAWMTVAICLDRGSARWVAEALRLHDRVEFGGGAS